MMAHAAQPEIQFQLIDKVVAQGKKRLESLFRETLHDINQLDKNTLDEEAQQELDQLVEAYRLVESLVMDMVDLKEDFRLKMLSR